MTFEIGEVLAGNDVGRRNQNQRIINYNYGLALHDVVYASKIYEMLVDKTIPSVEIIKETDNATYIAKYKEDGTIDNSDFKILLTTDMHLDEDYDLNDKTFDRIFKQIRDNKPDLVIFTGDCIQSKFQQIDAVQFAEWMEEIGVYWAYIFGNHEAREEKEFHKYLIFKSLSDFPHCLSKFGDPNLFGYGNFIVNIMNSETQLKQSLVFMDSGRDIIPAVNRYMGDVATGANAKEKLIPGSCAVERDIVQKLSDLTYKAYHVLAKLEASEKVAAAIPDCVARAEAYRDTVIPAMTRLREFVDDMEQLTSSEYWPLPSYGDLMFKV